MVNHGMSIDARHVMLLADLMTFKVCVGVWCGRDVMHVCVLRVKYWVSQGLDWPR